MTSHDTPGRSDSRFLMWAGHYSLFVLWGAVAANFAGDFIGLDGIVGWLTPIPWVAWGVALFIDSAYHQEQLCARCIAASPLDLAATVRRWKAALWWYHNKRFALLAFGVFAILVVVLLFMHPSPWLYVIPHVLALAMLMAFYGTSYKHRRLRAWCPWCRQGEGGDRVARVTRVS